jgi:phosphatidate cytidylyltransferase
MLKYRLLTAIILIPIVIFCIFSSSEIFGVLCGVFILLAAWEWGRIAGIWEQGVGNRESGIENQKLGIENQTVAFFPIVYALLMGCLLFLSYLLVKSFPQSIFIILSIACLFWLVALYWAINYQQGIDRIPFSKIALIILGIFILIPAWNALFLLHKYYGEQFVIFLFVLIWAADTAAYFSGRKWGRRKLADKISPGKTIEGVIGAIIITVFISLNYAIPTALISLKMNTSSLFYFILSVLIFMALCEITVISSVLGDLVESLFKRKVGIKDSSQILPGHGGVLDRIDSLTAAAPIFTLGIILLDNRL